MVVSKRYSCCLFQVSAIDDKSEYNSVVGALKSSGFEAKAIDTLWNIVGAVLHLVIDTHLC